MNKYITIEETKVGITLSLYVRDAYTFLENSKYYDSWENALMALAEDYRFKDKISLVTVNLK